MDQTAVDRSLYSTFETTATLAGANVERCDLPSTLDVIRQSVGAGPDEIVSVTGDLLRHLPQLSELVMEPAAESVTTVLSRGLLGVCSTGSVAVAEDSHADRLSALLGARHILVLPAERLVADLPSAAPYLRLWIAESRRYVTFITGPSRTADIEKVLTVGAHGPARLTVVVVDRWTPDD